MSFWKTLIPDEPFVLDDGVEDTRYLNRLPPAVMVPGFDIGQRLRRSECDCNILECGTAPGRGHLRTLSVIHVAVLERPRFSRKCRQAEGC